MARQYKVVSIGDALLSIGALCLLTFFLTKKKVKSDMQAELGREYQRGYNDALASIARRTETAQNSQPNMEA